MKGVKSHRVYPIPVITPKGMAVLSLSLLVSIAGFLFDISLVLTTTAILMIFGFVIWEIYRERNLSNTALKMGEIWLKLPKELYSGTTDNISCKLSFEEEPKLAIVRVRIPHPTGIIAPRQQTSFKGFDLNRTIIITLPITPIRRGTLTWMTAYLRISAGMGYAEWEYALDFARVYTAKCYPAIASSISIWQKALVNSQIGPRISFNNYCYGREFEALRPYVQGDDPRSIDWKRSARGYGLLVRKYQPETHQRVIVAIDCSRKMSCRIGNREQIEYATDAAATLIQSARLAGDECGLFAFSHQLICQVSPGRSFNQFNILMETLCNLEIGQLEPDYQLLVDWTHMSPRRSLLVLITTATNPASIEELRLSLSPLTRKHLLLVCAIRDHDLDSIQSEPASDLQEAYIISAAVREMSKIEQSMKLLRHSGIMAIHCTAGSLAKALDDQYFSLKATGRL